MTYGNKVVLGYAVLLTGLTLILLILSEGGIWPMSWAWILSPYWIGYGILLVLAEAIIVWKFFKNQYWK